MKLTTIAPANIAFIKYWGRNDETLFLPANDNISMTLSGCTTTCTIELDPKLKKDLIEIKFLNNTDFKPIDTTSIKAQDLLKQITRIQALANSEAKIHMKSINNFPSDAGIASSASSFAAVTAALLLVYGIDEKFEDKTELSREIRLCGSGSASRSAMGGFVELFAGHDHESSYAHQIADENHWKLIDLVAVVDPDKKKASSSEGHSLVRTSPYFDTRIIEMKPRIKAVRKAILDRDLKTLGECAEEDMLSMHLVMMTQKPALFYWSPGTIAIMKAIRDLRDETGTQAYCTIDAGPNVHVICEKKDYKAVEAYLKAIPYVKWVIYNEPCYGVRQIEEHLF